MKYLKWNTASSSSLKEWEVWGVCLKVKISMNKRIKSEDKCQTTTTKNNNKVLYIGWLKTTEMYFLTVLEARSPGSRCWQSWFLLGYLSFLLCPHVGGPVCICLDPNLLFLQAHSHTRPGPPARLHLEANRPCSSAVGPKKDCRYNDGDIHRLSDRGPFIPHPHFSASLPRFLPAFNIVCNLWDQDTDT